MNLLRISLVAVATIFFAVTAALATVTPHALFSDNMVLQQGFQTPVWGKAAPGEKVTVSIGTQRVSAVADKDGRWMVKLASLKPGGPYQMTIAGENNTITIKNILAGEVWVASGQSNMEYGLGGVTDSAKEIADANYPEIRVFTVKTVVSGMPLDDVSGKWEVCTPEVAGNFSAVGYLFARDLYKSIKMPVGLIHSAVSGTLAEAWTSVDALSKSPVLQPILTRYAKDCADYQQAVAEGKKPAPVDPSTQTTHPGGLFNGKIAPLIPYRIRGVVWWQGEYNSERCMQYKTLFPTLIHDWRVKWGQGDFPFLFVQLQNLDIQPQPNTAHYDEMREAQLYTWNTVPLTGMAMMVDAGDANNIHPPHKQVAAERLTRIARALVYGEKDLVYSGPIYRAMKVEGEKIRLNFDFLGGGLVSKSGDTLGSFVIAGADQKFVPAQAKIDGNTVVVWSPEVKTPVAVRYAWADNPTCTLYNKADLPASPFRTDDWPVNTTGKN